MSLGKRRELSYKFLASWDGDIGKRDAFLEENHIGRKMFNLHKAEWKAKEIEDGIEIEGRVRESRQMSEAEELKAVMDALRDMAVNKNNAAAARTFLQVKGALVEKQEVSHKVDADEYFRAREEAARRDGRDIGVPRRSLLPTKVSGDEVTSGSD